MNLSFYQLYLLCHCSSKSLMLFFLSPHLISYQPCKLFLPSFSQFCPSISFFLVTFLNQELITSTSINKTAFLFYFQAVGGRRHINSWSVLLNSQFNHILFFSSVKIILWICAMLQNPQQTFTLINLFDLHTKPMRRADQELTFLFCGEEAKTWRKRDFPESIHSDRLEQESNSRLSTPIPEQFPLHHSV